eukprot:1149842-Pelagomonas_calceolata.AAC.2
MGALRIRHFGLVSASCAQGCQPGHDAAAPVWWLPAQQAASAGVLPVDSQALLLQLRMSAAAVRSMLESIVLVLCKHAHPETGKLALGDRGFSSLPASPELLIRPIAVVQRGESPRCPIQLLALAVNEFHGFPVDFYFTSPIKTSVLPPLRITGDGVLNEFGFDEVRQILLDGDHGLLAYLGLDL